MFRPRLTGVVSSGTALALRTSTYSSIGRLPSHATWHASLLSARQWSGLVSPSAMRRQIEPLWHSPNGLSLLRLQQARSMFIQTQPTPNSDAVMFLPGREVMPGGVGSMDFASLRAAGSSPLARKLLAVDGVRSVFFGAHFITVTKNEDVDWSVLRPMIFEVVMDYFMDDSQPVIVNNDGEGWTSDTAINEDDSEVVAMIKELLETRVKPAVAEDGGSILFRGFHEKEGIVDLELQGACSSCSSSSVTLKSGVENMLRHYIPEVKSVREVLGEHASPMERTSHEQLSKVEQALADKGILRS